VERLGPDEGDFPTRGKKRSRWTSQPNNESPSMHAEAAKFAGYGLNRERESMGGKDT